MKCEWERKERRRRRRSRPHSMDCTFAVYKNALTKSIYSGTTFHEHHCFGEHHTSTFHSCKWSSLIQPYQLPNSLQQRLPSIYDLKFFEEFISYTSIIVICYFFFFFEKRVQTSTIIFDFSFLLNFLLLQQSRWFFIFLLVDNG